LARVFAASQKTNQRNVITKFTEDKESNMNVNDVAAAWKQSTAHVEPKWDEFESTQVTVAMAKRMRDEVRNSTTFGNNTRGNENGK
jgi:hypothetical protein